MMVLLEPELRNSHLLLRLWVSLTRELLLIPGTDRVCVPTALMSLSVALTAIVQQTTPFFLRVAICSWFLFLPGCCMCSVSSVGYVKTLGHLLVFPNVTVFCAHINTYAWLISEFIGFTFVISSFQQTTWYLTLEPHDHRLPVMTVDWPVSKSVWPTVKVRFSMPSNKGCAWPGF